MTPVFKLWKLFCLAILGGWLIMSQSCMKFRISDSKAKEKFAASGVALTTSDFIVNGFTLHYAKTGNDSLPTLLFIHGSPGGWGDFQKYMYDKDLLGKYRMISIDRPGFGYSQFGDAMHLDAQVALLTPLIQSFRNSKPIYGVGHSLGGPTVVRLQMNTPNLFTGIVLLAASVDPAEEKKEILRYPMSIFPLKYLLPGAFRPSNAELIYFKKDIKLLDKDWDKITCPAWIVHGNKDHFVPVGNAYYAEKRLTASSDVKLFILDGARHYIPWEQYADIKKVLMSLE